MKEANVFYLRKSEERGLPCYRLERDTEEISFQILKFTTIISSRVFPEALGHEIVFRGCFGYEIFALERNGTESSIGFVSHSDSINAIVLSASQDYLARRKVRDAKISVE